MEGYLDEFTADALLSVSQAAVRLNKRPSELTLREIGNALFGRGNVDPGGASDFDILEPLLRCNTMSYADSVKIERHLGSHSAPTRVVDVAIGDGQSVILWKNMKRRWAARYARWLVGVGGFHEHAHTMFGLNEMFFLVFVAWCLSLMGITKVFCVTKDLEHNNYAHVQQAHHAIVIAVVAFLLQDVVYPNPHLFLRSRQLYEQV